MRLLALIAGLVVAFAATALPAAAHRLPVAVTTVEQLEDGTVGITHRFHLHDALRVLAMYPDDGTPDPTNPKHQARMALYVKAHFSPGIAGEDGRPVAIEPEILGAEMDGDYFFVYQEMTLPAGTRDLWFRSTLLEEISDDWLTHINIELGRREDGTVPSLTFDGDGRWQQVSY